MSFIEPGGPVLITDGGLATELEARGHDLTDSLWFSTEQPPRWVAAGARVVGGCCRVRPADIADIAQAAGGTG